MKNNKIEITEKEIAVVSGGAAEEDLNGHFIIRPTSEVMIPNIYASAYLNTTEA